MTLLNDSALRQRPGGGGGVRPAPHLLAGEEHRARGEAQLEVGRRRLPQVSGARREVQHIVHQLGERQRIYRGKKCKREILFAVLSRCSPVPIAPVRNATEQILEQK